MAYARTPELRREVDTLLLTLSAHKAKHLKTRWDKPGWAPVVQLIPLIALIVWASMSITMSTPVSITQWVSDQIDVFSGQEGHLEFTEGGRAEVITDVLNLRTGPGQDYRVIETLAKGTQIARLSNSLLAAIGHELKQ